MRRCFHCAAAIADNASLYAQIGGERREVCCSGCAAAAQWIGELGLEDYYRLRSEPATRPDDAAHFDAWDRPAMRRMHLRAHADGSADIVFLVEGLRCTACSWLIERALGALAGVREVGVNATARRVRLVIDPARLQLADVMRLLARLGYTARPLQSDGLEELRCSENRDALKRLIVAGLGSMQAMMYAVALYSGSFHGIELSTRDFFRWLGFLAATPVVIYSARPFFLGAWREWRMRRLAMDTPVALAVALIYIASAIETIAGGREIYFDSVSMFVFFLLLARYVELRVRHRAGDLVDALTRLQPATAERLNRDGSEQVGVHELEAGDRVRVAAGASVPADGVLLSSHCQVDESLLSGESTAQRRSAGEALIAGSVLIDGPIELCVQRVGAQTVLAGIVRMATRAAMHRPKLARDADRSAARFIARVLLVTTLCAALWLMVDPSRAFDAALAVLVVSCPCAFALALPATLTRAVAALAQRGVLVVNADALEALARTTHFVFDKTGTLTEPRIELARVFDARITPTRALAVAAALEQGNTHPLACAFRAAAADLTLPIACELRAVGGRQIEGMVDGEHYCLGPTHSADVPGDGLVLRDRQGVLAEFSVVDRLRADAIDALQQLAGPGITLEILSGDAAPRVADAASRLAISQWTARATPQDKLARVGALRAQGKVVAMVGDGINDAPVLAAADVSVALASGATLAQAASGILLAGNHLPALLDARRIAVAMRRIVAQNLRWAAGYNLCVVPLAALGFIPPWLAAIGMSASSLMVVLNTLRIRAATPTTPTAVEPTVPNPLVALRSRA